MDNVSDHTTLKQFIDRAIESMIVEISSKIGGYRVRTDLVCWPRTLLRKNNVYMVETNRHIPL